MRPASITALLIGCLLVSGPATAQQTTAPVPLYPGAAPHPVEQEPLPPVPASPDAAPPPATRPPPPPLPPPSAAPAGKPAAAASERIFCNQPVAVRLADPDTVSERYRPFLGVWSDASWTPQLCAALVVENVSPDGTAAIVYAFGPMGSNTRTAGGVLHGTGVIRDGELRFQNSDGSQFVFRPLYADLAGRLTTPQGQTYGAVFKKTP